MITQPRTFTSLLLKLISVYALKSYTSLLREPNLLADGYFKNIFKITFLLLAQLTAALIIENSSFYTVEQNLKKILMTYKMYLCFPF